MPITRILRPALVSLIILAAQSCAQQAPAPLRVESARLIATIESLPVPRAARGNQQSRSNLLVAQQILFDQLTALGLDPRLEPIPIDQDQLPTDDQAQPYCNIIVDLPGTDLVHEVFIVAAHFDAVPRSPGADDNGTGVAAVLEIARILANEQHRRTIRLCLFNLEEIGLVGSIRHVQLMKEADAKRAEAAEESTQTIIGMVSLDMLGYFSDEPNSQTSPVKAVPGIFEPPTVGDFIGMVGLLGHHAFNQRLADEMTNASPTLNVELVDFLPVPFPDMMRSDHAPFLLAGIPAVMLSDTANFRNPNYHTSNDTIETIDIERFESVVIGLVGAARAIAETDITPR
jgi:Peptidase family M28